MRVLVIPALLVAAWGLATGAPVPPVQGSGPAPPAMVGFDEDPPFGGLPVPVLFDADRDGFGVTYDCNDDDPAVNPTKPELLNGLDDDCNGVVDDGFDTTIDWPKIEASMVVWPPLKPVDTDEFIAPTAQPRVVWTGDRYMAVWADLRGRLRLAQVRSDGSLLGTPAYLRKPVRSLDVAWTGTRLGIVYEDTLTGASSIRLMLVDPVGSVLDDVVLAKLGSEPKIAWGQDRFGVVWKAPGEGINSLRFRRFDVAGRPLSFEESLENSGSNAAIAFSGTTVIPRGPTQFDTHEGSFGIVYEAYYGFGVTGDVLLCVRPREDGTTAGIGPVRVNQHADPYSDLGAMPTIAANPAGFAVAWHAVEKDMDAAQDRFFSLQGLAAVQEFTPDADLGRYGRMTWTGSEFVMVNDNRTAPGGNCFDVHFRRVDPSGNTHLAAGWGPWRELRLRDAVPGYLSTHPDVANTGDALGMTWVEADEGYQVPPLTGGRLWLAIVTHK